MFAEGRRRLIKFHTIERRLLSQGYNIPLPLGTAVVSADGAAEHGVEVRGDGLPGQHARGEQRPVVQRAPSHRFLPARLGTHTVDSGQGRAEAHLPRLPRLPRFVVLLSSFPLGNKALLPIEQSQRLRARARETEPAPGRACLPLGGGTGT